MATQGMRSVLVKYEGTGRIVIGKPDFTRREECGTYHLKYVGWLEI